MHDNPLHRIHPDALRQMLASPAPRAYERLTDAGFTEERAFAFIAAGDDLLPISAEDAVKTARELWGLDAHDYELPDLLLHYGVCARCLGSGTEIAPHGHPGPLQTCSECDGDGVPAEQPEQPAEPELAHEASEELFYSLVGLGRIERGAA